MMEGECQSCHAKVLWIKMAKSGKWNPLDADPTPRGNVRILDDGTADSMTALELAAFEGPKYLSHHATCPDAKRYDKARK